MQKISPGVAQEFAAAAPDNVFNLSEYGGDPVHGEQIYLNQGGCRQCHMIDKEGGLQGPDLTDVAARLNRRQILTSIYNPGLEISPGYGTAVATLKDKTTLMGRIAKENEKEVTIIAPDGKESVVKRDKIETITPPISAMPPLGATMVPNDLRDLVAYIGQLTGKGKKGKDKVSHGDSEDEEIVK
jgi:quinoprotein glucose dehydrogenase